MTLTKVEGSLQILVENPDGLASGDLHIAVDGVDWSRAGTHFPTGGEIRGALPADASDGLCFVIYDACPRYQHIGSLENLAPSKCRKNCPWAGGKPSLLLDRPAEGM